MTIITTTAIPTRFKQPLAIPAPISSAPLPGLINLLISYTIPNSDKINKVIVITDAQIEIMYIVLTRQ